MNKIDFLKNTSANKQNITCIIINLLRSVPTNSKLHHPLGKPWATSGLVEPSLGGVGDLN